MIRFRLDDLTVEELPLGWDDLTTSLAVDRTLLYTRLVTVDTRLTWYRDGYRYLRQAWKANPECAEVLVHIDEDPLNRGEWETIYRGVIKLSAVQWSFEPDSVQTPVEDDSFYSYLRNNKDIEVDVSLPLTKNGQPITPTPTLNLRFSDPLGVALDVLRDCYKVGDVLRYVVEFVTDLGVTLDAPVFQAGGKYEKYVLQTAYRLRTGLTLFEPLTVTLSDLLSELSKNFHVGLQLRFTGGRPVLWVAPLEDLNSPVPVLELEGAHPVTVTYDAQRLYATVRAGSETTLDQAGTLPFPESIRWRGFIEEQYYLLGQCNLDAELDLLRKYVVSSNVLEDVIFNGNQDFDEEVCLVEYRTIVTPLNPALHIAYLSNWLLPTGASVNFYNASLTNEQVVRRWLGGIPSSLASELGNLPSGLFRASAIGSGILQIDSNGALGYFGIKSFDLPGTGIYYDTAVDPVSFNDDTTSPNFDQGGWYDPVLYRWTAATAGVYTLQAEVNVGLTVFDPNAPGNYFGNFLRAQRLVFRRRDSLGALIDSVNGPWTYLDSDQTLWIGLSGSYPYTVVAQYGLDGLVSGFGPNPVPFVQHELFQAYTAELAVNAGDYVEVRLEVKTQAPGAVNNWWVQTQVFNRSFACIRTTDFGDFTQQVDAANNLNLLVKFRAPLERYDLRRVLADPSGAVTLQTNGRTFTGWVENLKYDHGSGQADFTLATTQNLLP